MCLGGGNGKDQVALKFLGITRILGVKDKYYECKEHVHALVSDLKQESAYNIWNLDKEVGSSVVATGKYSTLNCYN